jgi:peroxiredoxin
MHRIKKENKIKEKEMALKVGQSAPDFILKSHLDSDVRLSQYLGKKNVVLAFFPLAWTPV